MKSAVLVCGVMWTLAVAIPLQAEAVEAERPDLGMILYVKRCRTCHGATGDGSGPSAAFLNSRPADFTIPQFWQGDFKRKMTSAMLNGKGEMPSFDLKPNEIRAIIHYIRTNLGPARKDDGKKH